MGNIAVNGTVGIGSKRLTVLASLKYIDLLWSNLADIHLTKGRDKWRKDTFTF